MIVNRHAKKVFRAKRENSIAQIVCANPDFELTDICLTPNSLEDAQQLGDVALRPLPGSRSRN